MVSVSVRNAPAIGSRVREPAANFQLTSSKDMSGGVGGWYSESPESTDEARSGLHSLIDTPESESKLCGWLDFRLRSLVPVLAVREATRARPLAFFAEDSSVASLSRNWKTSADFWVIFDSLALLEALRLAEVLLSPPEVNCERIWAAIVAAP